MGLWPTVSRLLPPNGFRCSTVIAKLDFTAVNLERMPLPTEIREFNQDIRECMKRVCREMGIGAADYGLLWCDEFGGWSPKKNSYNTNLHAHGVYVGPYMPREIVKALDGNPVGKRRCEGYLDFEADDRSSAWRLSRR